MPIDSALGLCQYPPKQSGFTEPGKVAQDEDKATLGRRFPFCSQDNVSLRKGIVRGLCPYAPFLVSLGSVSLGKSTRGGFPHGHQRKLLSWRAVCLQKQPTSGMGRAEVP